MFIVLCVTMLTGSEETHLSKWTTLQGLTRRATHFFSFSSLIYRPVSGVVHQNSISTIWSAWRAWLGIWHTWLVKQPNFPAVAKFLTSIWADYNRNNTVAEHTQCTNSLSLKTNINMGIQARLCPPFSHIRFSIICALALLPKDK